MSVVMTLRGVIQPHQPLLGFYPITSQITIWLHVDMFDLYWMLLDIFVEGVM